MREGNPKRCDKHDSDEPGDEDHAAQWGAQDDLALGYVLCCMSPLLAMAFAPLLLLQEQKSGAIVPGAAERRFGQSYIHEAAMSFSLHSAGFRNGGEIPRKY